MIVTVKIFLLMMRSRVRQRLRMTRKTKRQKKKEENECGLWAVYSGKRLSAVEKDLIENLPSDGVTGECRFSKSEKGYVNREIFLDVLRDLNDHLNRRNIARPVMLLIDGFSGHLGLEIAEFCVEFGIQLILLHSNMTHVIQPLGVRLSSLSLLTYTDSSFSTKLRAQSQLLRHFSRRL